MAPRLRLEFRHLQLVRHVQEALGSDVVGHDASGNPILKDIGMYLRDNIKKHISVRTPAPYMPA